MGLCVSTLIGRLLHMSWNAQVNVSEAPGSSSSSSSSLSHGDQVVDTQLKGRRRRRKKKALLREREAMNRDDPGTSLPDEILEDIFLRLPFFDLRLVERVCKTWKRVIASQSFRRSYKSTATLVEANYRWRYTWELEYDEIRDSSNKVGSATSKLIRWHRTITSHINGLIIVDSFASESLDVCNLFANTWESVPFPGSFPSGKAIGDETAIFHLGGGQYRLVYWTEDERELILTLTIGGEKQKWCKRYSGAEWFYTNPVVIGSSMFRVGTEDQGNFLVEYNHEADKVQSTRITSTQAEEFEGLFFTKGLDNYYLIVWQDKLYLLKQHRRHIRVDHPRARIDVWQISTDDGRATFLHKFEMEKEVRSFDVFEVDDEGVLHLEGLVFQGDDAVSLSYDMVGKCMREMSTTPRKISRRTLLPVRLTGDKQLVWRTHSE